ncbi:MAG TPA: DUF2608 domain-containing protein [Rickettsia endosymbiont of Degeeriella rufa]|nr:DUF2608 domain-containing protein [Rickettsia endosymbiont of Degeeriella rufa]
MILLSLFCLSANCFGDIIPTNDFKVIEEYVNTANKDTLVIFDVDDVLAMPTDEFAVNAPIRKELAQKLRERYSKMSLDICIVASLKDVLLSLLNQICEAWLKA